MPDPYVLAVSESAAYEWFVCDVSGVMIRMPPGAGMFQGADGTLLELRLTADGLLLRPGCSHAIRLSASQTHAFLQFCSLLHASLPVQADKVDAE